MAWLARRGHDCRVVARRGARRAVVNGVRVYTAPSEDEVAQHFQACDVMVTQLDASADAQLLAATYQTPLVQLVHSASQLEELGVVESCRALVAFNSEHVAAACSWWDGDAMVLRPPIDADRVRVGKPGFCTTLVNVSHNKGGVTLFRLAELMEERPFMGVVGAYGEQTMGPEGFPGTREYPVPTGLPANLRVFVPTETIGESVFAYTRVLLVLSREESYGRVAGEAIISGIPVIAALTPGTYECLGPAGHYVDDRDDLRGLRALIDQAYSDDWEQWSAVSRLRAEDNQKRSEKELRRFEKHLRRIVKEQPVMTL